MLPLYDFLTLRYHHGPTYTLVYLFANFGSNSSNYDIGHPKEKYASLVDIVNGEFLPEF